MSAILRRHQVPYLRECDPLTGEVTRSSKTTTLRYERDHPGGLPHIDVKKLGEIPDGGRWRGRGHVARTASASTRRFAGTPAGLRRDPAQRIWQYVRRILGPRRHDRRKPRDHCVSSHQGHAKIYIRSRDSQATVPAPGATHLTIRPRFPWQNAKVEGSNRTVQVGWAHRQFFLTSDRRPLGTLARLPTTLTTPLGHRRTTPDRPTVMSAPAEYP